MIGLKAAEIKQINFKLSEIFCPTHNRKTEVDFTLREVNYSKCCDTHALLCETTIEDLIVEIELARIMKKLGL